MASPSKRRIAAALLDLRGRTYAHELGIDVAKGTPSPLFRLLCAAALFSARIDAGIAAKAARGLSRRRWNSAGTLAESTWEQRVEALNEAGYTRYQERTATMLGDTAEWLRDGYDGDLRKLREEAERDPKRERKLLARAKGIGSVGVDIFFREAQVAWDELRPFADKRALDAAERLGLGSDAKALARHVDSERVPELVAALVRTRLEGDYDRVREHAKEMR